MATNFLSKIEERMFLKKYTNVRNLQNADTKQQVRWFRLVNNDATRKNALMANCIGHSAICILWREYYRILAPYISRADNDQFEILLLDYQGSALEEYMCKHTLSDKQVEMFLKHISHVEESERNAAKAQWLLNMLCGYIIKHGLTPELSSMFINYISGVEEKGDNKEKVEWLLNVLYVHIRRHNFPSQLISCIGSYSEAIADTIRKAIRVNNYVNAVTSEEGYLSGGQLTLVFTSRVDGLAAEKQEMPVEAQALMDYHQYLYYHEAGLKLSREAITAMISRGVADVFAREIFRNEDVYPMWPELHDTLMMCPGVLTDYQRVRKEKRQKEGIC